MDHKLKPQNGLISLSHNRIPQKFMGTIADIEPAIVEYLRNPSQFISALI